MKNEYGNCSECNKRGFIVNKTRVLCDNCNYKRLHKGKTRFEVLKEKQFKLKPKKYKKTGELEMFKEIWLEREHRCVKCGVDLTEPLNVGFFSHKKSKGAFPELRLDKHNIELLCLECHTRYEFGNRI